MGELMLGRDVSKGPSTQRICEIGAYQESGPKSVETGSICRGSSPKTKISFSHHTKNGNIGYQAMSLCDVHTNSV